MSARARAKQPPLTDEQRELVARYYPMCYHIAARIARRPGRRRDYHTVCESVQAGVMGLIRAVQLYDPTRAKPITYFYKSIRGAILTYWDNHMSLIHVPWSPRRKRGVPADRKEVLAELRPCPLARKHQIAASAPELPDVDDVEALRASLALLTPVEQMVLRERFVAGRILEDIGRQMGRTRERVRQIERDALAKLREIMVSDGE